MAFEVFDQVMQTNYDLLRINQLKLGKLTQILPVSILLVSHDKGSTWILLHFLVLVKQTLIYHLGNILKGLVYDGRDPTKVWSNKIILLTILQNIFNQEFSVLFVVVLLELFGQVISVADVLALLEFLSKVFVVEFGRFCFLFSEIRQPFVNLFLKFVLEDFCIPISVDIGFHDFAQLHNLKVQFLLIEWLVSCQTDCS